MRLKDDQRFNLLNIAYLSRSIMYSSSGMTKQALFLGPVYCSDTYLSVPDLQFVRICDKGHPRAIQVLMVFAPDVHLPTN